MRGAMVREPETLQQALTQAQCELGSLGKSSRTRVLMCSPMGQKNVCFVGDSKSNKVKTKSKTYPIYFGNNILNKTGWLIKKKLSGVKKICIISDNKLPKLL